MECRFEAVVEAVTDGLRRSERACGTERLRELEGRSERTCSKLKKTDYLSWGTPHRLVKMDRIKDTPVVKLLLLLPRHT